MLRTPDAVDRLIVLLLCGLASSAGFAQSVATAAPGGSGPYAVIMEEDPSLPGFTLYRPRDLAAAAPLPVVVWGNGSCRNVGNAYAPYHAEIASHGYLVVTLGPVVPGYTPPRAVRPTAETPRATAVPTTGPGRGPNETRSEQLIEAIDWAVAENARSGSRLFGELDAERIAAAGHSCGGLQALWAGVRDARIDTLVIGNSGTLPPRLLDIDVSHADLAGLEIPAVYLIGGRTDIAYPSAENDFPHLAQVFKANIEVGHGGTYQEPNGGEFGRVTVAWLDWQLKGRAAAAALFSGEACGLCTDAEWTVARRGIP